MATKTSAEVRQRPNILITGVPCTGKTTLAKRLAESVAKLEYIDVNEAIVKFKFHSGFDEQFKSFVLDEDKLLDWLEV
jgi:adenylate kinase